jgi:hypothetical protein
VRHGRVRNCCKRPFLARGLGLNTLRAHVVSYADDFVILSGGRAAEALAWTKAVMGKLGLTINEAKTSLRNARQERFDFLGYSFGRIGLRRTGIGIWARARPRRACNGSRQGSAIFWCRAISNHGRKCGTSSIGHWEAGPTTLATARGARHTAASTNTSLNVRAGSSREGTRCKGAAIADSHSM